MVNNRLFKTTSVLFVLILLTGCANQQREEAYKGSHSVNEIYEDVHDKATGEEVELLREGLRSRGGYGISDPVIPIRMPTEIVPVWKPPYADSITGRRISGHWEHMVIRDDKWFTD